MPVIAWWPGEKEGAVEVVHLRTTHLGTTLTVHAAAGREIGIAAGWASGTSGTARWERTAWVESGDAPQHIVMDAQGTTGARPGGSWSGLVCNMLGPVREVDVT